MTAPYAILFVCTGNICRSPTAEGIFRARVHAAGWEGRFHIDSAGTHGYHVGDAPDPRTVRAAAARGYDLSPLRARKFSAADFNDFDLILAMDSTHHNFIMNMPDAGNGHAKVHMFMKDMRCVPDPYYGGAADFETVLDMVENASDAWMEEIARELRLS